MVVACIALAIALSGAGYAAVTIPRNSVGTVQLKKNAVVSTKVKDRSLKAVDFAIGQLPAGPAGPQGVQGAQGVQGVQGPQGVPGSARAYAAVIPGTSPSFNSNLTSGFSAVSHISTGSYCLTATGISSATRPAIVSVDWTSTASPEGEAIVMLRNEPLGCAAGQYQVRTYRQQLSGSDALAAALTDNVAFNIIVP